MKTLLIVVLSIVLGTNCLANAQSLPAARTWGKVEQGVRTSAAVAGEVSAEHLAVSVSVEQQTAEAIKLEGAFVWLFVAQGKEKAYFSGKVTPGDVPAQVAAGETVTMQCEFAGVKAYGHRNDLVVKEGYPQLEAGAKELGTMGGVLPAGRSRGRVMLYVPAVKALVASNTVEMVLGDADVAVVLAGFSHDPVAAKDAHDLALKMGGKVLPDLIKLMENKDLPWFGQMWVAATLADLGDLKAVPVLVRVMGRGGAAAHVVAYHGWKLRSKALEEATVEAAGKDGETAAWAARGSQEFAKRRQPELVDAAIQALGTAKDKDKGALVECLEKTTGQKFGADAEKWKAWWKGHREDYAGGR